MAASPSRGAISASDRLYRLLLVAYPPSFRRDYGAPMAQLFRDCRREAARRDGRRGVAWVWLNTLRDLVASAFVERLAQVARTSRSNWIRWSGAASILAGALWIVALPALGEVLPQISHAGGHVLIAITALLSLLALAGAYARCAGPSGRAGKSGLVLGLLGTALVTLGNFLEGLWGIGVGWGLFMLGMLALFVGLLVFSGAVLRAGVLPRWSVWPFVMSAATLLSLLLVSMTFNISASESSSFNLLPLLLLSVFGLGWMALGYVLWSGAPEETIPPLAAG